MDHVHGDRLASACSASPPACRACAPQARIEVIDRQWFVASSLPGAGQSASTERTWPLDRRVGLQLRSEDVIHGFYVPASALKAACV